MATLTDQERACLDRYCALLHNRLGERLVEVRMFGSAARGDMWAAHAPMNSDIDVLVVTRGDVPQDDQEALLTETYPLYLECGRQLSPHFFSERRLAEPESAHARNFLARIGPEAVTVWPPSDNAPPAGARP
jgi:predicted nucleotidyltransferase